MPDETAVQEFFAAYGRALAGGDLNGVAAAYSYPSYVAGDAQSIAIAAPNEVKDAFAGAAEQYRRRGVAHAVPRVRAAEWLTRSLLSVDVAWSYTDEGGGELEAETFRYVLRVSGESVRICVVVAAATEV
ncbi:hypothetical protein ACFPZ0_27100 [Streptomonospora nanhaiensis]|uniref:DUF6841 domain-containing protein n=1 Tax=Streptomonospora nanhaiensis TaxID=1323731 RepID=A0A853BJR9_9ACTN|nr:hypothetical protein [Streptomonospora nanhaiensis]MBX9391813.1 hypothetical protein [Streptomonospora nanhaiensis]NYI95729.1 hypothetical protein [Streptomonospora nanhaiensis]